MSSTLNSGSATKGKPVIDVVVDTNVLFSEVSNPFFAARNFKISLAELRSHAVINLFFPEAVIEEVKSQKAASLREAIRAVNNANRILRNFTEATDEKREFSTFEPAFLQKFQTDLDSLSGAVISVDLPGELWKRIVKAACWKEGQFASESDAAFRDTVIAATAIEHAKKSGNKTVFLCNDSGAKKLSIFSDEERSRLLVAESLEMLKALINDLNKEKLRALGQLRSTAARRMDMLSRSALILKWALMDQFYVLSQRKPKPAWLEITSTSSFLRLDPPAFQEKHVGTEIMDESESGLLQIQSRFQHVYTDLAKENLTGRTYTQTVFNFVVRWTAQAVGEEIENETLLKVVKDGEPIVSEKTVSYPYPTSNGLTASFQLANPSLTANVFDSSNGLVLGIAPSAGRISLASQPSELNFMLGNTFTPVSDFDKPSGKV